MTVVGLFLAKRGILRVIIHCVSTVVSKSSRNLKILKTFPLRFAIFFLSLYQTTGKTPFIFVLMLETIFERLFWQKVRETMVL